MKANNLKSNVFVIIRRRKVNSAYSIVRRQNIGS